jgi:hypothetical protein
MKGLRELGGQKALKLFDRHHDRHRPLLCDARIRRLRVNEKDCLPRGG